MAEITTTSIDHLPSEISSGAAAAAAASNDIRLDEKTISEIVNGLQQASMTGATRLPSRDIPMTTHALAQDAQSHPDYIPPPKIQNYIHSPPPTGYYASSERKQQQWDGLFDDMQESIVLAVLFLLFQLPVVKQGVQQLIPSICNVDGKYTLGGLVLMCCLFSLSYNALKYIIRKFSQF